MNKTTCIAECDTLGHSLIKIRVMMLSDAFNNISAISWWSVVLVAETEVPDENH
jgi:hypothetical protein